MNTIFRTVIFVASLCLVFFGWVLIFLGFGIIGISSVTPFIKQWMGFFGIGVWVLVFLIIFLEKRIFSTSSGIDVEGEFGRVWITKKAIEELIEGLEIEGCEDISCKISIKGRSLDIKVSASCFVEGIASVIEGINKEISHLLEDVCLIRDYRRKIEITKIKKKRQLK